MLRDIEPFSLFRFADSQANGDLDRIEEGQTDREGPQEAGTDTDQLPQQGGRYTDAVGR